MDYNIIYKKEADMIVLKASDLRKNLFESLFNMVGYSAGIRVDFKDSNVIIPSENYNDKVESP